MPPYHHVKVTWGSRHGSGTGGGGGVGGLGSPHQIIWNCTVEIRVLSILNIHFKDEASLLIQKRKSARYENSFCSL